MIVAAAAAVVVVVVVVVEATSSSDVPLQPRDWRQWLVSQKLTLL